MTATEVKAKLLALLDEVENGEEIEITRRGRTIARISPARKGHGLWGKHAGLVATLCSDEELYSTGERWNAQ
jgi:prevent-host-death family protein